MSSSQRHHQSPKHFQANRPSHQHYPHSVQTQSHVNVQSFSSYDQSNFIYETTEQSNGRTKVNEYRKGQLLGRGGFAECYEVTRTRDSKIFAMKVISLYKQSQMTAYQSKKSPHKESGTANKPKGQTYEKALDEAKIMKALNHPNVVRYETHFSQIPKDEHGRHGKGYGHMHGQNSSQKQQNGSNSANFNGEFYIVMQYCSNGVLFCLCGLQSLQAILKKRKILTEFEVRYYVVQMVEILKYLKQKNILHRDLKPANYLLDDQMRLKVADFGLATALDYNFWKSVQSKNTCGTPNYLCPEMLQKNKYSYEADLWSVGVAMYTMLYGIAPFETPNKNCHETYEKIRNCEYSFKDEKNDAEISTLSYNPVSNYAKDLISKILVHDPKNRIKLQEILEHPFIKNFVVAQILPSEFKQYPPTQKLIDKYGKQKSSLLKATITVPNPLKITNSFLNETLQKQNQIQKSKTFPNNMEQANSACIKVDTHQSHRCHNQQNSKLRVFQFQKESNPKRHKNNYSSHKDEQRKDAENFTPSHRKQQEMQVDDIIRRKVKKNSPQTISQTIVAVEEASLSPSAEESYQQTSSEAPLLSSVSFHFSHPLNTPAKKQTIIRIQNPQNRSRQQSTDAKTASVYRGTSLVNKNSPLVPKSSSSVQSYFDERSWVAKSLRTDELKNAPKKREQMSSIIEEEHCEADYRKQMENKGDDEDIGSRRGEQSMRLRQNSGLEDDDEPSGENVLDVAFYEEEYAEYGRSLQNCEQHYRKLIEVYHEKQKELESQTPSESHSRGTNPPQIIQFQTDFKSSSSLGSRLFIRVVYLLSDGFMGVLLKDNPGTVYLVDWGLTSLIQVRHRNKRTEGGGNRSRKRGVSWNCWGSRRGAAGISPGCDPLITPVEIKSLYTEPSCKSTAKDVSEATLTKNVSSSHNKKWLRFIVGLFVDFKSDLSNSSRLGPGNQNMRMKNDISDYVQGFESGKVPGRMGPEMSSFKTLEYVIGFRRIRNSPIGFDAEEQRAEQSFLFTFSTGRLLNVKNDYQISGNACIEGVTTKTTTIDYSKQTIEYRQYEPKISSHLAERHQSQAIKHQQTSRITIEKSALKAVICPIGSVTPAYRSQLESKKSLYGETKQQQIRRMSLQLCQMLDTKLSDYLRTVTSRVNGQRRQHQINQMESEKMSVELGTGRNAIERFRLDRQLQDVENRVLSRMGLTEMGLRSS